MFGRRFFSSAVEKYGSSLENVLALRTAKLVTQNFVDAVVVKCSGGHGGTGCVAYEKHAEHRRIGPGKPAGGPGGRGGQVIVEVDRRLSNFSHFDEVTRKYKKMLYTKFGSEPVIRGVDNSLYIFKATNAQEGSGKFVPGDPGEDVILPVPLGTTVSRFCFADQRLRYLDISRWKFNQVKMTAELDGFKTPVEEVEVVNMDTPGSHFVIARGGDGGRGNTFYDPHGSELGLPGERSLVRLSLTCLADVGLVGFPNAGKSSLLAAISRSKTQIDPKPFTTLAPHLGTLKYKDDSIVSIADLPGLIEGAHINVGHGVRFLRHMERTRVLAIVIDMANEQSDPIAAFFLLRKELEAFSPLILAKKPFLVIANKCDVKPNDSLPKVDELWETLRASYPKVQVLAVSCLFGDGLERVVSKLRSLVDGAKAAALSEQNEN